MSQRFHCNCARCRVRGLTGPAVLITIGVLFLVDRSNWDWGFHRTWPVILLVIGAIKLAESMASTEGHVGYPPPPQASSNPPQPPYVPPPPPPPTAH
ncbi:MAG TPA: DUF5668 domain-containing protein [Candidatus Acidoferrales bacterium]|nr:DUF5668 domain-containing protein [Candidatus Acidoferrales bacterium]